MPGVANAQKKRGLNMPLYDDEPYHFGFTFGLNQRMLTMDYKENFQEQLHPGNELQGLDTTQYFKIHDIYDKPKPSFTVGIVGNLRLSEYFDLRFIPSLGFGDRDVTYEYIIVNKDKQEAYAPISRPVFVELPLQVKFRSQRYYNISAYIIAGANYKINMQSLFKTDKNKEETSGNTNSHLILRRHDIAAEIGSGFNFYISEVKLGIEIKMSYGLINLANFSNKNSIPVQTNSFDKLRSKAFLLSFTIE